MAPWLGNSNHPPPAMTELKPRPPRTRRCVRNAVLWATENRPALVRLLSGCEPTTCSLLTCRFCAGQAGDKPTARPVHYLAAPSIAEGDEREALPRCPVGALQVNRNSEAIAQGSARRHSTVSLIDWGWMRLGIDSDLGSGVRYTLKLIKSQVPYFSRSWKKNNQMIVSSIDLKVLLNSLLASFGEGLTSLIQLSQVRHHILDPWFYMQVGLKPMCPLLAFCLQCVHNPSVFP